VDTAEKGVRFGEAAAGVDMNPTTTTERAREPNTTTVIINTSERSTSERSTTMRLQD